MKPTILVLLLLAAGCASGGGSADIVAGYTPVPATVTPATKTIDSFTVTGARGIVNRLDNTIKLYLPEGTIITALSPAITLENGYTISPASGTPTDFTGSDTTPVPYTVTKTSDGSQANYAVQVFNGAAPTAADVDTWLGRGINLGNDLDAHPGDEGSWTGGVVAKEYFFDDYKALGFDSVRIPITWGAATTPSSRLSDDGPSSTVNSDFMTRVDTIAGWGIDHGLAVVINAHHEDWIRAVTGTAFTNALPRFEALWKQIADHFKDWPPQLVFEILNEPQGNIKESEVNTLNADILSIIRGTGGNNATRTVIVGPYQYNAVSALTTTTAAAGDATFAVPNDGSTPHLIANFHDYNPWSFAGMSQGTWGSQSDINTMKSDLDGAVSWAASHGHIPLYMGEYGVTKEYTDPNTHVTTHPDAASRISWYTTMAAYANSKGISAVAWDDYGDFKLYDRVGRTFETAVKTALFTTD